VDAASLLEDPTRVLPALVASEKAMPNNYNASLRLGQMQTDAKQYDQAIAACDRGLKHVTGPVGRTWLLQTEADALIGKGDLVKARGVLKEALRAAQTISVKQTRENNIRRIENKMKAAENKPK
jgi:predicted negative regulator of RcsB-dependent stress response